MPSIHLITTVMIRVLLFVMAVFSSGTVPFICRADTHTIQETSVLTRSPQNREIKMFDIGSGKNVTLLIGGIHGDEPLTVTVLERFLKAISDSRTQSGSDRIVVIPLLNPDGLARKTRTNANGIDINRNFPAKNWKSTYTSLRYNPGRFPASEPETKAIIELCDKIKPCKIIVLHSPMRLINYDGPAEPLAKIMGKANKYPIRKYIGYETPGSIGTFYGKERNIPTITLELSNDSIDSIWKENQGALRAAVDYIHPQCGNN